MHTPNSIVFSVKNCTTHRCTSASQDHHYSPSLTILSNTAHVRIFRCHGQPFWLRHRRFVVGCPCHQPSNLAHSPRSFCPTLHMWCYQKSTRRDDSLQKLHMCNHPPPSKLRSFNLRCADRVSLRPQPRVYDVSTAGILQSIFAFFSPDLKSASCAHGFAPPVVAAASLFFLSHSMAACLTPSSE